MLTEAQRVLLAYDELKRTTSALTHEHQHTVLVWLAWRLAWLTFIWSDGWVGYGMS